MIEHGEVTFDAASCCALMSPDPISEALLRVKPPRPVSY